MVACRCEVLNVLSGAAARDYVRRHLFELRTDGMGRTVHRCSETSTEWVAEMAPGATGGVSVLRRRHG